MIVPVYNVAPYLARCVDALLGQTYSHLEILLVDDASTDMSQQIIADYAKRDARIVPLYQAQNQGVSAARNRALDTATGSGCAFATGTTGISRTLLRRCSPAPGGAGGLCGVQLSDRVGQRHGDRGKRPQRRISGL